MRKTARTKKLYHLILDMFFEKNCKGCVTAEFVGIPINGAKKNDIWVPKALASNIQGPKKIWVPKRG